MVYVALITGMLCAVELHLATAVHTLASVCNGKFKTTQFCAAANMIQVELERNSAVQETALVEVGTLSLSAYYSWQLLQAG
jgi:hypothetical protein